MKNTFKKITIHLFVALIIILPMFVFAQGTTNNSSTNNTTVSINIKNPLKTGNSSLMALIVQLLNNVVMPIGAVACVMWIIFAGFKFVTAQGKPVEIEKAKKTLLWALVGTGILLGAAGISKVVQTTVESIVNY